MFTASRKARRSTGQNIRTGRSVEALGRLMRIQDTHESIRNGRQSGFTLLEAMIVVVIIAILATLAVSGYRQTVIHAREAALHSDLDVMRRMRRTG
jgi:prepilin-type N-terminal cleavage/methylation domain-containing protein